MTKLTRSDLVKTAEQLTNSKKLLVALAIILAAVFIPIPPVGRPVEELNASGSFMVVNGIKIHYIDTGSGDRTFILLHGFGAGVFSWREVIRSLNTAELERSTGRGSDSQREQTQPRRPITPTQWMARQDLS